jgi:nucleoid-associated protein YgaU
MTKSKREVDGIDEAALLQSVFEQDNPPAVQPKESVEPIPEPEKPKETKEPVKRKRGSVDYSSLFLQKNELKARSCVYISQRIHNTISEIVRVIADKDVSVGGYIDNVLLQHLEAHKDEINDLYKQERKDLI